MTSNVSVSSKSDDVDTSVKILIIDLSRKFGGASSRVLSLMQNFPSGQATLAVLKNSPIAVEALRLGLTVVIVGDHKASPLILFNLISLIRKNKYQVLDTQNPQSKFWGSMAALFTGISLVSTLNSWYIDEHCKGSLKGFLYALLELGTNFSLKHYIVVSQSIFDALVRFRVSPAKIHLIYNAVATKVDSVLDIRSTLIEKYNLPANCLLVVTAGRFVWAKGYDDLISAFQLVAREDPNVYCLIAGDGELYTELKESVDTAELGDRVFFLGHISRDDVLSLIKACDLFVMSSRSEGTPMVLLEAASLQKPIVTTNVGGIPELLTNEDECILVPPRDIHALAAGMKKILLDKKLSEHLSQAAYLRVQRDFSISKQVQETLSVYAQA